MGIAVRFGVWGLRQPLNGVVLLKKASNGGELPVSDGHLPVEHTLDGGHNELLRLLGQLIELYRLHLTSMIHEVLV